MPRPQALTDFLRLAEDYAQAANTPRRASAHAALEKAAVELTEDKARLDWLEKGGGLVCIAGRRFVADFDRQDWGEYNSAREAIDAARNP